MGVNTAFDMVISGSLGRQQKGVLMEPSFCDDSLLRDPQAFDDADAEHQSQISIRVSSTRIRPQILT